MSAPPSLRKKPAPRRPAWTVAELLRCLGDVPADRVRLVPTPGRATTRHLTAANASGDRLFELVDGVLVEKSMGFEESRWAYVLGLYIGIFLLEHDLGAVLGADGLVKLAPGLVRSPDLSFISWGRYPREKRRAGATPDVAPDLAVEILSRSNTRREMERKLAEYFAAGVRLVWIVDPKRREVRIHASPSDPVVLTAADALDGGDVLPGFRLALAEWFAQAERDGPAR
ncbi:Uma2 family endonuclease [Paludisphaera sp.]|uniref:Uma2 family endonuclease n=1 Tax=Paludisphaera sp. TaxID=2017432 RepID=UPI00301BB68F